MKNDGIVLHSRWDISGVLGVVCLIGVIASAGYSDLIDIYGGHYDAWPTAWNAVSSLNDPNDGVASELDFVGDSSDPCFYYHVGSQYIYFRCRVADGAADADTYRDSVLVTIDQVGVGNVGEPDYAFAWDYLENKSGTTLAKGQEWRLQLGSIANATDHNNITEDVAGSYSPGSTVSLTWSGPISTVPEPSCIGLMMLGAVVLVRRYKHL